MIRPFLIAASIVIASNAIASSTPQYTIDYPHWVLSFKTLTINQKLTDTNLRELEAIEQVGIQYALTPNIFADADLILMRANTWGYKFGIGFELPGEYFTPYTEVIYNQALNDNGVYRNGSKIDYDVGVVFALPTITNIHLLAELDNPIKDNEAAKIGIGYNFSASIALGVDYFMGLNNKSNGAELELDYIF